jgi:hypothetical protein
LLSAAGYDKIPPARACYLIYRPSDAPPEFLEASAAGRYQGRDPTVKTEQLQRQWVDGADTLYIGKAVVARTRLQTYARFGAGEPVAHRGGRLIWQLSDSEKLLVAWHEVTWEETPRTYEKRLLAKFASLHGGRRPSANLTG